MTEKLLKATFNPNKHQQQEQQLVLRHSDKDVVYIYYVFPNGVYILASWHSKISSGIHTLNNDTL